MKGFVTAAFFVLASSLLSSSALAQQLPTPDENGLVPAFGTAGPTGPTNGTFPPLVLPTVATSKRYLSASLDYL